MTDPSYTLKCFCEAYLNDDYETMYKLTQKSYCDKKTILDLKSIVLLALSKNSDNKATEFTILDKRKLGDAAVEIMFTFDGRLKRAMLICETAPYQPSIEGEWGVNPISLLRQYI
jgi:hypothetical protein